MSRGCTHPREGIGDSFLLLSTASEDRQECLSHRIKIPELRGICIGVFPTKPECGGEKKQEQRSQRRTERPIARLAELVLDDIADEGDFGAAEQIGDGEHADGRDEDEENAGDDAGFGQGKDNFCEDFCRRCAEVESGFEEAGIEFFDAAVNGERS